jgi:hypothetical protein
MVEFVCTIYGNDFVSDINFDFISTVSGKDFISDINFDFISTIQRPENIYEGEKWKS